MNVASSLSGPSIPPARFAKDVRFHELVTLGIMRFRERPRRMHASASRISISVVVPVWNDAIALGNALPGLLHEWDPGAIWVVDGGSEDRPGDVAKRHGVRFLEIDAPSRARQMNAGAVACDGDVILFLHADTRLPEGARSLIAESIANGAVGGAFSRRFDNRSLFLRLTCLTADWRGQRFGAFFGDQAIFATRDRFETAGPFPDQPLFEDFEFTRRLSRHGRTVLLKPPVISSGRRFHARGPVRQTLSDFALTIRYVLRGAAIFDKSTGVGFPPGNEALGHDGPRAAAPPKRFRE